MDPIVIVSDSVPTSVTPGGEGRRSGRGETVSSRRRSGGGETVSSRRSLCVVSLPPWGLESYFTGHLSGATGESTEITTSTDRWVWYFDTPCSVPSTPSLLPPSTSSPEVSLCWSVMGSRCSDLFRTGKMVARSNHLERFSNVSNLHSIYFVNRVCPRVIPSRSYH